MTSLAERIVFTGTLAEVQDRYYSSGWSDGLPIIPPTPEAVRAFLGHTPRQPDDVIGTLQPEGVEATVTCAAVVGVMAGCRPEYMPILVAIVEVLADPSFRLEDAGSTPGWEPLVVVSGPIVNRLEFNHEAGVMRVGRMANTTIGRFARLFMRTVAGFRIPPDSTDKGSIGFNFNVALPESLSTTGRLGWPSFGEDQGYARDVDVVTVQSMVGITPPMYTSGTDPDEHLTALARIFGDHCASWCVLGLTRGEFHPLLILSPLVADTLAAAGLTKDDIRAGLHERARVSPAELERYNYWRCGTPDLSGLDPRYVKNLGSFMPDILTHESGQPWGAERTVPIFPWPEQINIVVAGDPGRNHSRGYMNNHRQGPPISREIHTG